MKKISLTENQFRLLISRITYDNPITIDKLKEDKQNLYEGLIATYPLDSVMRYMPDYLGIDGKYFTVNPIKNYIYVFCNELDDKLIEELIRRMEYPCGYYLASDSVINGERVLQFEPKYQDDITREILKYHFLVHLSPSVYREKIMANGLVPKSTNGLLDYSDRVYLFIMEGNILDIINKSRKLISVKGKGDEYDCYIIDINKIPSDVKFNKDENMNGGIWTYDNIPPQAIKTVKRIKV